MKRISKIFFTCGLLGIALGTMNSLGSLNTDILNAASTDFYIEIDGSTLQGAGYANVANNDQFAVIKDASTNKETTDKIQFKCNDVCENASKLQVKKNGTITSLPIANYIITGYSMTLSQTAAPFEIAFTTDNSKTFADAAQYEETVTNVKLDSSKGYNVFRVKNTGSKTKKITSLRIDLSSNVKKTFSVQSKDSLKVKPEATITQTLTPSNNLGAVSYNITTNADANIAVLTLGEVNATNNSVVLNVKGVAEGKTSAVITATDVGGEAGSNTALVNINIAVTKTEDELVALKDGLTANSVTISATKGSGQATPYFNDKDNAYKLYYNNLLTIKQKPGYLVDTITINYDNKDTGYLKGATTHEKIDGLFVDTINFANAKNNTVTLTCAHESGNGGQVWIKSIVVSYKNSNSLDELIQNWIDSYLHLKDYDPELHVGQEGQGLCKGNEGYYAKAKAALNQLEKASNGCKDEFKNNDKFNTAQARYEAWGIANDDAEPYNGSAIIKASDLVVFDSNTTVIAIATISVFILGLIGLGLVLAKRKKLD